MKRSMEAIRGAIVELEITCIEQATTVVKNFRIERKALHDSVLEEIKATERTSYERSRKLRKVAWCQLSLFSRVADGSLQIYWQTVHRSGPGMPEVYKYIAKKKEGGYDLRQLLAKAHEFERALVKEYEEHAEHLRERWKAVKQLKAKYQTLYSASYKETALLRRQRMAKEAKRYDPPA
jgi:hypothetical protein